MTSRQPNRARTSRIQKARFGLRRSSLEIRQHARHITQHIDYLPYGNRPFPEDRNFIPSTAIDDSAEGGSYEPGIEEYHHMVSEICHIICSVNN